MLRRTRTRLARRRVERQRELLRTCTNGSAQQASILLVEAINDWLRLDGRKRFTCPNRSPWSRPGPHPQLMDWITDDGTCSYCGGRHEVPDDVRT